MTTDPVALTQHWAKSPGALALRAMTLREAFDQSFARAPDTGAVPADNLLGIVLGGAPHALRLSAIEGLFADKTIVGLPSTVSALRGIVGLRSTMLPVYDLAALIGLPRSDTLRWIVVAAGAPIAFGIEQFESHLRVHPDAILPIAGASGAHNFVHEIAHAHPAARPIVHLPSVIAAIQQNTQERTPHV